MIIVPSRMANLTSFSLSLRDMRPRRSQRSGSSQLPLLQGNFRSGEPKVISALMVIWLVRAIQAIHLRDPTNHPTTQLSIQSTIQTLLKVADLDLVNFPHSSVVAPKPIGWVWTSRSRVWSSSPCHFRVGISLSAFGVHRVSFTVAGFMMLSCVLRGHFGLQWFFSGLLEALPSTAVTKLTITKKKSNFPMLLRDEWHLWQQTPELP